MQLTFKGWDSWDRPVYESEGQLYCDTDPRSHVPPSICTKNGNEFDGEPCDHVSGPFKFIPKRATW